MKTDRILLEILRNKFQSIAEEMAYTIQRTGHTIFVTETADFGTGVANLDGEFFAYPVTVGVSPFVILNIRDALRYFDTYEPGDIVLTNDPYSTGGAVTHLTDVNLFKPIFHAGELICFAWAFVHASDVGGKAASSISPSNSEVYQEGFRVAPVKLYKGGTLNREFLTLLLDNCRTPDGNWGDIKAVIAALNTAEQKVEDLVRVNGKDVFLQGVQDVLEYAEKKAELAFSRIPDGTYEFWDYLDSDLVTDIPVRIAAKLTVNGSHVTLDYTGTDPQVKSAFNLTTMGKVHPWVAYKLVCYVYSCDKSVPINGGLARPISVLLPDESIVNCKFPSACGVRLPTAIRANDVVHGALCKAVPEQMPAASSGAVLPVVLSEPNYETGGRNVMVIEPMAGGSGAADGRDGIDARDIGISNLKNNPIEIVEARSGVIIREYGLRKDSGGPGKYRGGTGTALEFKISKPGTLILARGMERYSFNPWGMRGGRPGANGRTILNPGTGVERDIGKIDVLSVNPGDVVRVLTAGGGGYGHPLDRNPESVLRDFREGLVSRESSERDYGVIIDGDRVDVDKTDNLRGRLRELIKTPEFSFGKFRENYESNWPAESRRALIDILYTLPSEVRHYAKEQLVRAVEETSGGEPILISNIQEQWEQLRTRLEA